MLLIYAMGLKKVTKYHMNWNAVAMTVLYIVLLTWIVVFGMCIPVLAQHMSGRCFSDGVDTGKKTAKMLASLTLTEGTFIIGAILGCFYRDDHPYWAAYAMYVLPTVVIGI